MSDEKTVVVYGASDDLIELEGDIREEFGAYDSPGDLIVFSEGTVLRIVYDGDGIWRVTRLVAGTAEFTLEPGDVAADTNDRATLRGDLQWAVLGKTMVFANSRRVIGGAR